METNSSTVESEPVSPYRDTVEIEILEERAHEGGPEVWVPAAVKAIDASEGKDYLPSRQEEPVACLVIGDKEFIIRGIRNGITMGGQAAGRKVRPEEALVIPTVDHSSKKPQLFTHGFPSVEKTD